MCCAFVAQLINDLDRASKATLINLGFVVPFADFNPIKPFAFALGEANKAVVAHMNSLLAKDLNTELCL